MKLRLTKKALLFQLFVCFTCLVHTTSAIKWNQISQTRTTYLETYKNYIDGVVMHFDIPENAINAAFKFRGRNSMNIIGCPAHDVELYLQYGAPPVINPDKATFPEGFLLSRRETIFDLTFKTDQVYSYINISSPTPGSYYATVFFPYVNPKDEGITQDGLFPVCNSFVDATLFVQQLNITPIVSEQSFAVSLKQEDAKLYKIYIPWNVYKVIIAISEFNSCPECEKFEVQVSFYSSTASIAHQNVTINGNMSPSFRVLGDDDYYIKILSNLTDSNSDALKIAETERITFNFDVKFIETLKPETTNWKLDKMKKSWPKVGMNFSKEEKHKLEKKYQEMFYLNSSLVSFTSLHSPFITQYDEYPLYKTISSDSFQFGYELEPTEDGYIPININISSVGFTALKFNIRDVLDVGGTLNIALAFRPRFRKEGRWIYVDKEPKNHTIVACLHRAGIELPVWENQCQYLARITPSPLILNESLTNSSLMIPYPEPGNWYLTFKLFCGDCIPCDCPSDCKTAMTECLTSCEANCGDDCHKCQDKCEKVIMEGKAECAGCECDGNCKQPRSTEDICNSSIMYDISSYPCVGKKCGSNGKCSFGLSEGFVYSTCVCTNNYRGWDCEDDANANTLFIIWLELTLLVFSNFAFMLTVYVAYKRGCYVEALTYASILFSSTFYHACDAGENRINFCLVSLHVLQFCDFYCAILAIWVTLIAMAYLPQPYPHLLHVAGAIFLGAAVTMDKTSLWVFVIPLTIGAVLVLLSWGIKNYRIYKTKEPNSIKIFPSKRYLLLYLPIGLLVALVGLLAFALFETQSNYKFVHSLWHIMMAITVVILLPKEEVFVPKPDIVNANGNENNTQNSF